MTRAFFSRQFGILALVGLVTLPGCSGDSVDLGNTPGNEQLRLDGRWVGTLSGDLFVTSPKRLTLELDQAGKGTLLVGEAALDPPSDPTVGYPPEAEADAAEATGLLLHLYDGVSYRVDGLSVIGGRTMSFDLDVLEAFAPWCALQTPVLTDNGYNCLPYRNGGVNRSNGEKQCFQTDYDTGMSFEEDCLAIFLCGVDLYRHCVCTATDCSMGGKNEPATARFTLTLDADENTLSGEVDFVDGVSRTTPGVELVREGD